MSFTEYLQEERLLEVFKLKDNFGKKLTPKQIKEYLSNYKNTPETRNIRKGRLFDVGGEYILVYAIERAKFTEFHFYNLSQDYSKVGNDGSNKNSLAIYSGVLSCVYTIMKEKGLPNNIRIITPPQRLELYSRMFNKVKESFGSYEIVKSYKANLLGDDVGVIEISRRYILGVGKEIVENTFDWNEIEDINYRK